MFKVDRPYSVCVIDIGSPKLGNLGWCLIDTQKGAEHTGSNLDALFPHIAEVTERQGLILGLEAPLFVPLRPDLMSATKARKGEGRRPWSAGAGAQVLTMNLPITAYLFKGIQAVRPDIVYFLNEKAFVAEPKQIMIFEALVSGADKGSSHINDAQIMTRYCVSYAEDRLLPPSILEYEEDTEFFNLAAAALLRHGLHTDPAGLSEYSPIYKPTSGL